MKSKPNDRVELQCPYAACSGKKLGKDEVKLPDAWGPRSKLIVRKGFFDRSSDRARIRRYQCRICQRSFSQATFSACFRQIKRGLNQPVFELLVSGVSLRRTARLLKANPKTVVRKMLYLSAQAKLDHRESLRQIQGSGVLIEKIQFDEMETFEHSKCLPLSIPLAVHAQTRKILGFQVCQMPAKGPLASISRKKYGPRKDDRRKAAHALFQDLRSVMSPRGLIESDENPKYPSWIRSSFKHVRHELHKGRRGCSGGQGELKRIGFDPLFSLNHTCAMLRANVNRLFRRTWCTTKRRIRLEAHLWLYVQYHNRILTKSPVAQETPSIEPAALLAYALP